MAERIGLLGKVYRLTTGSRASWGTHDADDVAEGAAPSNLTEIEAVKDVDLGLDKGTAEVLKRGITWALSLQGIKRANITLTCTYNEADDELMALFYAYLNNGTVALAILSDDKATANTEGFWADFAVKSFKKSEPLEEVQMVTIEIAPTVSDVDPEWVRVTA